MCGRWAGHNTDMWLADTQNTDYCIEDGVMCPKSSYHTYQPVTSHLIQCANSSITNSCTVKYVYIVGVGWVKLQTTHCVNFCL